MLSHFNFHSLRMEKKGGHNMLFPSGMKRIELEMVLVELEQDRCPMQITGGWRVHVSYPSSATDHTIHWSSVDHLTVSIFCCRKLKNKTKNNTQTQPLADLSRQILYWEDIGKLLRHKAIITRKAIEKGLLGNMGYWQHPGPCQTIGQYQPGEDMTATFRTEQECHYRSIESGVPEDMAATTYHWNGFFLLFHTLSSQFRIWEKYKTG